MRRLASPQLHGKPSFQVSPEDQPSRVEAPIPCGFRWEGPGSLPSTEPREACDLGNGEWVVGAALARECPEESLIRPPSPAAGPDASVPASPWLRGASALLRQARGSRTAGAELGSGGSHRAGRDEARAQAQEAALARQTAAHPSRSAQLGSRCPATPTPRADPAGPPITAPAVAQPARAPAPAAEGAGVSDLKTHSPSSVRIGIPEPLLPGGEGTAGPTFFGPASSLRQPTLRLGGKVWGGGDCLGNQFRFPCQEFGSFWKKPKPSIQPPWQEKEAKALGATPPPRLQLPGRSAGPRRFLLFKAKPSLGGRRKNPRGAVQPELGDCSLWTSPPLESTAEPLKSRLSAQGWASPKPWTPSVPGDKKGRTRQKLRKGRGPFVPAVTDTILTPRRACLRLR
ncbi:unnamed protein product [Rangifer tarandus platyrhynchus]|uniref:Uncharacterized protein n=1 Tax=Rangifer tarandus platyrhynchus TaxID=3082113 RepID=A0AC60A2G2_RANTA